MIFKTGRCCFSIYLQNSVSQAHLNTDAYRTTSPKAACYYKVRVIRGLLYPGYSSPGYYSLIFIRISDFSKILVNSFNSSPAILIRGTTIKFNVYIYKCLLVVANSGLLLLWSIYSPLFFQNTIDSCMSYRSYQQSGIHYMQYQWMPVD